MEQPPEILVDARGHRCPVPTLRLRRALERADGPVRIVLIADDPLARLDVPHFCAQAGLTLTDIRDAAQGWRFHVERG